jgi:hypothetical protein
MGPSSISNPFFPLRFFGIGAHKLHFLNHFLPLTQSFSSGYHLHFSPLEYLSMTQSGMPTHVQKYQIHVIISLSSYIVDIRYSILICVGTWSSQTSAAPSGI